MPFHLQRFESARQVVQACSPVSPSNLFNAALQVYDRLSSTNKTAWEQCNQGAPPGTAVLALEQTAGRGQWGRQWVSSQGGLYLSVILTPDLAAEQSAQLTICTAWGIATALRTVPSQLSGVSDYLPVQLKWPNDLVVDGRKLGGILTETRLQQGQITRAVVGVGINWTNPVPAVGINLQSILETQPVPLIESLEMLTAITLHGLLMGYQRWQQTGIEAMLSSYLDLLAYRDRPIQFDGQWGTIVGISPMGALRVQMRSPSSVSGEVSEEPSPEILLKPGTISLGYDS